MGFFQKTGEVIQDKVKGLGQSTSKYVGFSLIKNFFNIGKDTLHNAGEQFKKSRESLQELEKNPEKHKKFLSGEAFLRERERNGFNLAEVDKYYLNMSGICLFLFVLMMYCFISLFLALIHKHFSLSLISYFISGCVFALLYLNCALDAATIRYKTALPAKIFLTNPKYWMVYFILPRDWSIGDKPNQK